MGNLRSEKCFVDEREADLFLPNLGAKASLTKFLLVALGLALTCRDINTLATRRHFSAGSHRWRGRFRPSARHGPIPFRLLCRVMFFHFTLHFHLLKR